MNRKNFLRASFFASFFFFLCVYIGLGFQKGTESVEIDVRSTRDRKIEASIYPDEQPSSPNDFLLAEEKNPVDEILGLYEDHDRVDFSGVELHQKIDVHDECDGSDYKLILLAISGSYGGLALTEKDGQIAIVEPGGMSRLAGAPSNTGIRNFIEFREAAKIASDSDLKDYSSKSNVIFPCVNGNHVSTMLEAFYSFGDHGSRIFVSVIDGRRIEEGKIIANSTVVPVNHDEEVSLKILETFFEGVRQVDQDLGNALYQLDNTDKISVLSQLHELRLPATEGSEFIQGFMESGEVSEAEFSYVSDYLQESYTDSGDEIYLETYLKILQHDSVGFHELQDLAIFSSDLSDLERTSIYSRMVSSVGFNALSAEQQSLIISYFST